MPLFLRSLLDRARCARAARSLYCLADSHRPKLQVLAEGTFGHVTLRCYGPPKGHVKDQKQPTTNSTTGQVYVNKNGMSSKIERFFSNRKGECRKFNICDAVGQKKKLRRDSKTGLKTAVRAESRQCLMWDRGSKGGQKLVVKTPPLAYLRRAKRGRAGAGVHLPG